MSLRRLSSNKAVRSSAPWSSTSKRTLLGSKPSTQSSTFVSSVQAGSEVPTTASEVASSAAAPSSLGAGNRDIQGFLA